MAVTPNSLTQIRNDGNNNFNLINSVGLLGFPNVMAARFCPSSKFLTLLTADSSLCQFRNYEKEVSKCFKIEMRRDERGLEAMLLDYHYCSELEVILILNSRKELYLFERLQPSNCAMLDLEAGLPNKLKGLHLNSITYSLVQEKGRLLPSVILCDDSGFLLDVSLKKIYSSRFSNTQKEEHKVRPMPK